MKQKNIYIDEEIEKQTNKIIELKMLNYMAWNGIEEKTKNCYIVGNNIQMFIGVWLFIVVRHGRQDFWT